MIRQAINCDMCGTERVEASSRWFVADEIKGEIRLRAWESQQKSRRNARHLCGQKCVQRMMDNFTAGILAVQQAGRTAAKGSSAAETEDGLGHEERPILERMGYDRETIAQVEADSWAGPVKEIPAKPSTAQGKEQMKGQAKEQSLGQIKEQTWVNASETRGEKGFIHATRLKSQPQPLRAAFQRMA